MAQIPINHAEPISIQLAAKRLGFDQVPRFRKVIEIKKATRSQVKGLRNELRKLGVVSVPYYIYCDDGEYVFHGSIVYGGKRAKA